MKKKPSPMGGQGPKDRGFNLSEVLEQMPWLMRMKMKEQIAKYIKAQPSNIRDVEELYYRALGYPESEVKRRMVMEHKLKCHPKFFLPLKTGDKTLEIRKNDRNFKVGDILILEEWDPGFNPKLGKVRGYTGNVVRRQVTHVLPLSEVPGMNEPLVLKAMTQEQLEKFKEQMRINTGRPAAALLLNREDEILDEFVALSVKPI